MQSFIESQKNQILEKLKSYDWNVIFNFIFNTIGQMNDNIEKFVMSMIRDTLISSISKDLQYKDENGNDLSFLVYITNGEKNLKLNTTIECKFCTQGYLFVPIKKDKKGEPCKRKSHEIILINNISDEKNKDFEKILKKYAPIILCVEPHCVSAVFTKDLLENNLIQNIRGQTVAKNISEEFFHIISKRDKEKIYNIHLPIQTRFKNFICDQVRDFNELYAVAKREQRGQVSNNEGLTSGAKICNNHSTEGENDMPARDNSTKKAQEFIKKYKLTNFTAKKIQELFFKEGITKNYKCSANCLERLVKMNFLTKTKNENGKNVYYFLSSEEISSQKKFEFSEENTNTQEISNKKIAYSEENDMHSDISEEYSLSAISKEVMLGDLLLKISNCIEITRATKYKLMNNLLQHTQPDIN